MKKLLTLGLAAAMILSLAACGGGNGGQTSANGNQSSNASSAAGSQAGGDASGLPEITAGSCATPAILTSIGQSADVEIVGTLSDSFITPAFEGADIAVVVSEGDGDGLMSGILAGNSTPSAYVEKIADTVDTLKTLFGV